MLAFKKADNNFELFIEEGVCTQTCLCLKKTKGENSGWGYAWVPIAGPFIGGGIAFGLSKIFGLN
jgi:glycerol uptake facilitator-like aquaporin